MSKAQLPSSQAKVLALVAHLNNTLNRRKCLLIPLSVFSQLKAKQFEYEFTSSNQVKSRDPVVQLLGSLQSKTKPVLVTVLRSLSKALARTSLIPSHHISGPAYGVSDYTSDTCPSPPSSPLQTGIHSVPRAWICQVGGLPWAVCQRNDL